MIIETHSKGIRSVPTPSMIIDSVKDMGQQ